MSGRWRLRARLVRGHRRAARPSCLRRRRRGRPRWRSRSFLVDQLDSQLRPPASGPRLRHGAARRPTTCPARPGLPRPAGLPSRPRSPVTVGAHVRPRRRRARPAQHRRPATSPFPAARRRRPWSRPSRPTAGRHSRRPRRPRRATGWSRSQAPDGDVAGHRPAAGAACRTTVCAAGRCSSSSSRARRCVLAALAGALVVRRSLRPLRPGRRHRRAGSPRCRWTAARSTCRCGCPTRTPTPAPRSARSAPRSTGCSGHVGAALAARHASETRVRQFVADASHELRTPLASIRGYAELARRGRADGPADVGARAAPGRVGERRG